MNILNLHTLVYLKVPYFQYNYLLYTTSLKSNHVTLAGCDVLPHLTFITVPPPAVRRAATQVAVDLVVTNAAVLTRIREAVVPGCCSVYKVMLTG